MKVVILGSESDIARALVPFFQREGWQVEGWARADGYQLGSRFDRWDLVLCAIGTLVPVGTWHEQDPAKWDECFFSNTILPIQLLINLWPKRNADASVCFLAGPNPNQPMVGYAAYSAAKIGLLKACEHFDFESRDAKFFALGPGYVPTKIHKPTLEKGWKNERIEKGGGTPIEDIYRSLMWCYRQPKEVVGGRNVCVSDYTANLDERLETDRDLFKLRRAELRRIDVYFPK